MTASKTLTTPTPEHARQFDVIGDRWTLLVVRDLLAGKHRFGDLCWGLEQAPARSQPPSTLKAS